MLSSRFTLHASRFTLHAFTLALILCFLDKTIAQSVNNYKIDYPIPPSNAAALVVFGIYSTSSFTDMLDISILIAE